MKRSKVILVVLIVLFAVALVAAPALARREGGRRAHPRGGMMAQFTVEQQEQIEAIHEKYNDERAELTNRAKVLALELKDLVGEPGLRCRYYERDGVQHGHLRLPYSHES